MKRLLLTVMIGMQSASTDAQLMTKLSGDDDEDADIYSRFKSWEPAVADPTDEEKTIVCTSADNDLDYVLFWITKVENEIEKSGQTRLYYGPTK